MFQLLHLQAIKNIPQRGSVEFGIEYLPEGITIQNWLRLCCALGNDKHMALDKSTPPLLVRKSRGNPIGCT